MSTLTASSLLVRCHTCEELHVAEYSHEGRFNEGPVFAVVCDQDWLTDYYTTEGLEPVPCPVRGHHAHPLADESWHHQDGNDATLARKVRCDRNGRRWFLVDGRQPSSLNRTK
jgi:hypothetical protein